MVLVVHYYLLQGNSYAERSSHRQGQMYFIFHQQVLNKCVCELADNPKDSVFNYLVSQTMKQTIHIHSECLSYSKLQFSQFRGYLVTILDS